MSDTQQALYQRRGNYIPRVAAVHDMCGYGKCSLTVAIPVLSAAGIDVCPVPTALFSAHTKYPVFTMHDTTEILNDYLDAWQKEGVDLDGVYSGFLGSAEQVALIKRLYAEYPHALHIVDPVMGDGGEKYPTYTDELCQAMADLVDGADILTPTSPRPRSSRASPMRAKTSTSPLCRRTATRCSPWAPSPWSSRVSCTRARP